MSGAEHTPGPWGWFGNLYAGSPILATRHNGRRYVMQFARFGFQGAQPRFQLNHRMVDGTELARFEVGDRDVLGLKAAKKSASVYRYDMIDIDHPDARLIAASPCLHEALEPFADIDGEGDVDFPDDTPVTLKFGRTTIAVAFTLGDLRRARRAIAKAAGRE